jgi:hypothetical protein
MKNLKTRRLTFKNIVIGILLAGCALGVIYTISLILRFATSPNQMDFGEGFSTYVAQLWATGQFNWNPNEAPYMTLMYGTVFPTLMSPFIWLFGPDLRIGRAFSILATAIIAFLIYLIAKRYSKNKLIPFIAAGLPFTYFGFQEWIMQTRCDMTAICFEVIGLYLAIRFWHSGNKILWSVPFVLLAFFTKQIDVSVGLAIGVGLLIVDRKMFLKYFCLTAGGMALIILTGNLLTGGQFWNELVTYNITTPFFNPSGNTTPILFTIIFPLTLGVLISFAYIIKGIQAKNINLPMIWVLVAMIVNGFTLLRYAAFINYAIESILAMGLVTALYFDTKIKNRVLVSMVLGFQILMLIIFNSANIHFIPMPDKDYQSRISKVQAIIADATFPIYTEHAGVILGAGKSPYYEPFVFTQLIRHGDWNVQILLNDLENENIQYLVLQSPYTWFEQNPKLPGHIPIEAMPLIKDHYTIVYSTYDGGIYNHFWYSYTVYESNKKIGMVSK